MANSLSLTIMSCAPRSSLFYKFAVLIALFTILTFSFLNMDERISAPSTSILKGEVFMSAHPLPVHQQTKSPLPSDSQSPSEEFEEDDDDSNREMRICTSFSGASENLGVISGSRYYPPIQLDITTPPPRV